MIQARIDNNLVSLVAGGRGYFELNEQDSPVREHSFPAGTNLEGNESFFVNGHHYRTGSLAQTPCTNPDCARCGNDVVSHTTKTFPNGCPSDR